MIRESFILTFLLTISLATAQIITEQELEPYMFTSIITGDATPLKPTTYAYSQSWAFPVEVYDIVMTRAYHQFLPSVYSPTEIFAYAGYVDGKLVPSYPGPTLSVLKNMPCYVVYTNNISGRHILPVDTSPPFDMITQFQDEVPVVPHAHGLETEMGPDGQPMGFWTKSGRKGPDYFSLKFQNKKPNQAIFRYHNTKQGIYWYHDHAMAITRLNVYAGLVGLYQIIDPQVSYEESNILKVYGDVERKFFTLSDKTFKKNGQLYYPDQPQNQDFQYWVPEFFGNTMIVNGKVWPKVVLEPKIYRIVFLNACQSRFLNIYFEQNDKKLDFQIFRRDSDFLQNPVTLQEHLLLLGGRIEIFLDLRNLTGVVMMRNNAKTPSPDGDDPTKFMQQIMKIEIKTNRLLQQKTDPMPVSNFLRKGARSGSTTANPSGAPTSVPDPNSLSSTIVSDTSNRIDLDTSTTRVSSATLNPNSIISTFTSQTGGATFLSLIQNKMDEYLVNQNNLQSSKTIQFLDEPQAPNYNTPTQSSQKKISLVDFINSNDQNALSSLITTSQSKLIRRTTNTLDSINIVTQIVNRQKISSANFLLNQKNNPIVKITDVPYPRFPEGKPYFTILSDVQNDRNDLAGVMIDGVPVRKGCQGSSFQQGAVYDFFIINFTMDDHPIHIHLVNFQIIRRFKFQVQKYKDEWQRVNGQLKAGGVNGIPKQIDVRPYMIPNSEEPPREDERQFLDVIFVPKMQVTVARVKFSNHYGKSFPFDIAGARYVWHCHILEHEDNEMMRYFCVE